MIAVTGISDLQCPRCAAENAALGGGTGYADAFANHGGALWGICAVHAVCWYVTRELLGIDHDPTIAALPRVEAVWRGRS